MSYAKTINDKTVRVKLSRTELIDLLLLCSAHFDDAKKWELLHDKLYAQLYDYDTVNEKEVNTK